MATDATHAFGCTLTYDDEAAMGASKVVVGQVESIGDLSLVCDDIEVTNHGSTDYDATCGKCVKQYIPGNIEGGEISVTLIALDTQTDVYASSAATDGILGIGGVDTTVASSFWEIKLPDGSKWVFHGYLKGITQMGMTTNDALRLGLTIKIDGSYAAAEPTFTKA